MHAKLANPCYSQAVHTNKDLEISDCKCIKVLSKQITASLRSSVITEQKYSPEAILLSQGLRNVSTQTVKNEIETWGLVKRQILYCNVQFLRQCLLNMSIELKQFVLLIKVKT